LSIRYLAQELYRLTKKVEELERALAGLGPGAAPARRRLEAELRKARQDREHLHRLLESKKEKPLL
jgi:hypothetical protein